MMALQTATGALFLSRQAIHPNVLLMGSGFDEKGQDLKVKPGDNFFKFATGSWEANLQMPADHSRWGSFDMLAEDAKNKTRGILENDMKTGGKPGKFYEAYMNEDLIERLDKRPIESTLEAIKAIRTASDFAAMAGKNVYGLLPSPFSIGIEPDARDVNSYSVSIDQAGIGLPREYYLEKSFAAKKAAYARYITKVLGMVGWPNAEGASRKVLALEDRIANASWSDAERRDPIKTYNPMSSTSDLATKAPGFDWVTFLAKAGDLPKTSKIIVGALSGVVGIAKILGETNLDVLRAWATYHFTSAAAPILSKRFLDVSFELTQALTGQKEISARWKRAVTSVNSHLGDAVGKAYVGKYFPESSKIVVEKLTQDIKHEFGIRIKDNSWMTNSTKEKALHKLSSFTIQVGYPKKFKNYTGLTVLADDLYGNVERAIAFSWDFALARLGKLVDRDEWMMTPQTVNAYNMPMFNQVVFPAAILQPPFFDPNADMAVNYGGIGAVIGHEMTHGFDDSGRKFNAMGQLDDWWTEADSAEFKKRAEQYGQQFKNYDLGVDAHIKPDLTMGEDIADLGGLSTALAAFKRRYVGPSNHTLRAKGSHTANSVRLLFLGWAQVWREKQRKDALINQLTSDAHPPAEARVNIPCTNLDDWYTSFGVQQGDKLYLPKEKRILIW
jgi:putative endopeptidase